MIVDGYSDIIDDIGFNVTHKYLLDFGAQVGYNGLKQMSLAAESSWRVVRRFCLFLNS